MNTKEVTNVNEVGTWQHYFERTCSDRVKKGIVRAVRTPEVCLEHALTEIEVRRQTDGKGAAYYSTRNDIQTFSGNQNLTYI